MKRKWTTIRGIVAVFAMTGIASANLLSNGDFSIEGIDPANAAGWTEVFKGGWINRETHAEGITPDNFHYALGDWENAPVANSVYQDVPGTEGLSYQLKVDAYVDAWVQPTGSVKIEYLDSGDGVLASFETIFSPTASGAGLPWSIRSVSGVAPSGTVTIRAVLGSVSGEGTVRFDNARLNLFVDPLLDTDADGLPDAWELDNGLDRFDDGTTNMDNGAAGDPDEDTLVNIDEYTNDTNPQDADTDEDGLTDAEEVNTYLTLPLVKDTDEDLLSDGDEVNLYGTDPLTKHSDADGEDDFLEIFQGTDPNDDLSNSTTAGLAIIDGILDAAYGAAIAVQTVNTSGIDNQNELDAAYTVVRNNKLYLMLTGNMGMNWEKCEIFIDSTDAVTTNVLETAGNDSTANLNGMTFDAGFSPDYHLMLRGNNTGSDQMNLDVANLATKAVSGFDNVFGGGFEGAGYTGTGAANSIPISIAFNNTNTAGVVFGSGSAADQSDALAVNTGLELCIDLFDLGIPSGEVRISVMMVDEPQTYLFNQVLGGVPPQDSLGTASAVDFSDIPGDQYFVAFDGSLDSDSDGLPDTWEWAYGLDPYDDGTTNINNGASGDPEPDGLVNSDEYALGTNPRESDTDGDGLTDGEEASTYLTLPLVWDTDGDTLSDGDEINVHGTNPLTKHSDADGEDDALEIWQGTDPTDTASSSAALDLIIVDGSREVIYGDAVSMQTVNTAWEDNLDELDAAYARVQNDRLYLMLTGNMNTNWNSIEIFIDSSDAITTNVLETAGGDNTGNMNGLVFDNGFSPDYHLNIRLGVDTWTGAGGYNFNVDFSDLATKATSYQLNLFNGLEGGIGYMGSGDASSGSMVIAFNNSNTAGLVSGTDAASVPAVLAVSTGLELGIALSDLGNPYGEIRIMAMMTSDSHATVGNQILGGLVPPKSELGTASTINFNASTGNQFFSFAGRPLPAPAIASMALISGNTEIELGVAGLQEGYLYKVQNSADLVSAGFVDVAGSEFTAAGTNDTVIVPMGADPALFLRVVAP